MFDPRDPKLSPAITRLLAELGSITTRLEGAVVTLEAVVGEEGAEVLRHDHKHDHDLTQDDSASR